MRSHIPDDSHPGIHVSKVSKRSLSSRQVAAPVCNKHGENLGAVSEIPELTLRKQRVLAVCPECFGTGEKLDTMKLHRELDSKWDKYDQHFVERAPPTTDDTPVLDSRFL